MNFLRRILDWMVGRSEPDPSHLRDRERRLEILSARVDLRRRQR